MWHQGERTRAIEHHQAGINLLKDGARSLELVRLYEEAASLYMQTGDNMLAIYAAEKALRLAEQLGETRAASRAHGIFGRVFGRIGDAAKARESLERSVELAQDLDPSEAVVALVALGQHLDIAEADYERAAAVYAEALALAERIGDVPAQVEVQAGIAQVAVYRGDWDRVREACDASELLSEREGLVGKLCLAYALRGLLSWREGEYDDAERLYRQALETAEHVGWSEIAWAASYGLGTTLRDRGDTAGAVGALGHCAEICDRAGLIAHQVQAMAARAVTLALVGDEEAAREAATAASERGDKLPYPVARASAREAEGITTPPPEGSALLAEARAMWEEIGRPLDAARCSLLEGMLLARSGLSAGEAFSAAAERMTEAGVPHLAERAREQAEGATT
jgi:tetratricopeptide (TPR) repeat protein